MVNHLEVSGSRIHAPNLCNIIEYFEVMVQFKKLRFTMFKARIVGVLSCINMKVIYGHCFVCKRKLYVDIYFIFQIIITCQVQCLLFGSTL